MPGEAILGKGVRYLWGQVGIPAFKESKNHAPNFLVPYLLFFQQFFNFFQEFLENVIKVL